MVVKIRGRIIRPNDVFIWNASDGFRWHPMGRVSRTVKTDDCLATMIEINNDTNPKIVGYSRSRECSGKVVDFHLNENANCIHGSTGSGGNTDQYVFEPQNQPSINLFGQYNSSQNSRVVQTDGISYCVTNGHKDGTPKIAIEPNVMRWERTDECKKLRKQNGDKGMKFNAGNKEYHPRTDGMSNTLSTSTKDNLLAVPELRTENGCLVDRDGKCYRIRKLTPRECFRLQDVSESDIDKMLNAKIAKTNLYKLAGNSICISPMYHIFRKIFIQKECESQQLELF